MPWIGIVVAVTFSLYGLIRKKVKVSSDIGLLIETLLISPIAIFLFIFLVKNNANIFSLGKPILSFYLFWAGLMTLIPLFWYTKGFNLIGIGPASMIFFLTPTAQFFLGLYYFNEPLILDKLISFIFIWIAVIIYLNELRKEWNDSITRGTAIDTVKEINNKFPVIKELNKSFDNKFPTKILLWKSMLGKKSSPNIRPQKIDDAANVELTFLLKKP